MGGQLNGGPRQIYNSWVIKKQNIPVRYKSKPGKCFLRYNTKTKTKNGTWAVTHAWFGRVRTEAVHVAGENSGQRSIKGDCRAKKMHEKKGGHQLASHGVVNLAQSAVHHVVRGPHQHELLVAKRRRL